MQKPKGNAEALLASIARLAAAQASPKEVALLAIADGDVEPTSFDNWNGGTTGHTLTLSVPVHFYAQIQDACESLEEAIKARAKDFFKKDPNEYLEAVRIVPAMDDVDEGWRDKAKAWAAGKGLTNQGRVRSDNVASRAYDGLLFRSEAEINLYKALKATGVTFAPLPVFLRGGSSYQRLEPDFILIKDGVMLHVEVDGDTVHHETPAEAHARTALLLHEGVPTERVKASECADETSAAKCAQKLLAVLAKHKISR